MRLNTRVNREQLEREGFDEVIVATGVVPRALNIEGVRHHKSCLMQKCYVVRLSVIVLRSLARAVSVLMCRSFY